MCNLGPPVSTVVSSTEYVSGCVSARDVVPIEAAASFIWRLSRSTGHHELCPCCTGLFLVSFMHGMAAQESTKASR